MATQSDIASQMGISVDTLQNYKLLAEMIPELEELLETNIRQRGDVGGSAKKVELRNLRDCMVFKMVVIENQSQKFLL